MLKRKETLSLRNEDSAFTDKDDAPQSSQIQGESQTNPSTKKASPTKAKEGQLAVDVLHSDTQMVVICPIAGASKADMKVSIENDVLTIRGEREKLSSLAHMSPLVEELYWGPFSRSIVLPDHIDRKGIKAKTDNHLLVITIPKTEDFKTRIIHINE